MRIVIALRRIAFASKKITNKLKPVCKLQKKKNTIYIIRQNNFDLLDEKRQSDISTKLTSPLI